MVDVGTTTVVGADDDAIVVAANGGRVEGRYRGHVHVIGTTIPTISNLITVVIN